MRPPAGSDMTLPSRFLLAAALLLAPAASAQVVLTTAVPFLQIEPDSRASGMGMTGVALADNAYAVFWNPAGLAEQTGTEVSFTHAPWLPALGADLSYEHLTAKHSLGDLGTIGGHLTYFDLGEQQATDDQGNVIDDFSSYEFALGASYGKQVTENLSVGAGGRLIYSNLTGGFDAGTGSGTSAGVSGGFDLGVKYRGPELGLGKSTRPSFGANLANFGPGISYTDSSSVSDAIPTTLRFGTAVTSELDDFNKVTFAVDLNKVLVNRDSTGSYDSPAAALFSSWGSRQVDTTPTVDEGSCASREGSDNECDTITALEQLTLGVGAEYWYNDLFSIRGGYFYESPENGNRNFLTIGSGIRYSLVGVDLSYIYALEENSPIADQLRFTLLLNIPR